MIRRLRIKFVCINMAIVLVMLCAMFLTVYFLTRQNLERRGVDFLKTAAEDPSLLQTATEDPLHPPYLVLEVERDGGWYAVSREEVQETSNLLSLPPGETGDFSLFLSPYREELEPGNYRMVFYFVQQEGFFALPFQLLSDEAYAGAEFPAALVVGGTLYASTGRPMPGEAAPSAILGTVRSYAEELPTEEGQSNFDWSCTAPYAETADGLAVLVDREWTLFEPLEGER